MVMYQTSKIKQIYFIPDPKMLPWSQCHKVIHKNPSINARRRWISINENNWSARIHIWININTILIGIDQHWALIEQDLQGFTSGLYRLLKINIYLEKKYQNWISYLPKRYHIKYKAYMLCRIPKEEQEWLHLCCSM